MQTFFRLTLMLFVATVSLSAPSLADTPVVVSDSQAGQYVGQTVAVEGVVTAVSRSSKGNTFINFGGIYPKQTFTGWIPAGTPSANGSSLLSLQGKKIKISGKIGLHRGKPEIRIVSRNQIIGE